MKTNLAILVVLAFCNSVFAEMKTETVSVPMRDSIKLATDVYRDDAEKLAPVVLMHTPYDRTKQKAIGERWAKAGYIFVAQDCRGTRASEGVLAPYNNEGQDGYDTIEWLTRQSWCNGRVAFGSVGRLPKSARNREKALKTGVICVSAALSGVSIVSRFYDRFHRLSRIW